MDIEILLALQQFRSGVGAFLSEFLLKMTFLGELNTVMVVMAVIYWSVNKELGTYLLMGWSSNRLVNGLMKVTACAYRPWILERRCVGFSTEVSAERKLTRTVIGVLAYYAISLILVPWIKAWIPGPSGTMTSCFSQMFYVSFLFPWCMKRLERGEESRGRGQGRAGALPGDPRM